MIFIAIFVAKRLRRGLVLRQRYYGDYQKLLENMNDDGVHICAPNKSHAEIIIAALRSMKVYIVGEILEEMYESS